MNRRFYYLCVKVNGIFWADQQQFQQQQNVEISFKMTIQMIIWVVWRIWFIFFHAVKPNVIEFILSWMLNVFHLFVKHLDEFVTIKKCEYFEYSQRFHCDYLWMFNVFSGSKHWLKRSRKKDCVHFAWFLFFVIS